MTAILKVDTIQDTAGNNIINESSDTITIGASGDTIALAGTTVTGITQGITVADQWRLTANKDGAAASTLIAENLERIDDTGYGQIGSGMTQSSGIWTFPSTGIYLILVQATISFISQADVNAFIVTNTTTNNSTYAEVAQAKNASTTASANSGASVFSQYLFDVSNTSNCKVKFTTSSFASNGTFAQGDTNSNYTSFGFYRLGDT